MEDKIPRGLQHCPKTYCEKGGYCGRQACMITPQRCNFQTSGLAYDSYLGKTKVVKHRLVVLDI